MNITPPMKNEPQPEFVTDAEESMTHGVATASLTGRETVVFELEDHEVDELLSALG